MGSGPLARHVSGLAVSHRPESDDELSAPREAASGCTGGTDFLNLLNEKPDPNAEETAFFNLEYRHELFRWAAARTRHDVNKATWNAFQETCIEGQSAEVVAEQLGMSRGAVYVAKSRVMARLRKLIQSVESEGEA